MPGLVEFFETLRTLGIGFVLATNNATKTAEQHTEKLQRFGVEVPPGAILTSAVATANHLGARFPEGATAYVVGEIALRQALEAQGFHLIEDDVAIHDARVQVDLVVVGFAPGACYPQLAQAAALIDRGAHFVGTNPDVTIPHEVGPLPGAGSFLAFLQVATGRAPVVIGKPERAIFDEALRRLNGSRQTTIMVGDRLGTDIAGAQAAGMRAILLLTGVTHREDLKSSQIAPDLTFENLRVLTSYLVTQANHRVVSHGA